MQSYDDKFADMINLKPCMAGCLFEGARLTGDCRAPASRDCKLNRLARAKGKPELDVSSSTGELDAGS